MQNISSLQESKKSLKEAESKKVEGCEAEIKIYQDAIAGLDKSIKNLDEELKVLKAKEAVKMIEDTYFEFWGWTKNVREWIDKRPWVKLCIGAAVGVALFFGAIWAVKTFLL